MSRRNALPYESASSGKRALADMQHVIERFGAESFGHMFDYERGLLIVQFRHHGRTVHIEASTRGYAAAWLRAHPWSGRSSRTRVDHEREATRVAQLAVHSILRDWLKGQIAAIETGVLSFEGAFLGQLMLESGQTALHQMRGALPPEVASASR